jgi:hypothetical protein
VALVGVVVIELVEKKVKGRVTLTLTHRIWSSRYAEVMRRDMSIVMG